MNSAKNELVTVIIPCFNYGCYIGGALESLLMQSYSSWECIIIDDGSTDDTKEVVARFLSRDKRFKYMYQSNKGMSAARNLGMREASGTYLQFLDADDLLEKRKLELHVCFLDEHPEVDIVYGDARYFPSEEPEKRYCAIDRKSKSPIKKISGGRKELISYMIIDNMFVISSPMLRKKLTDACGYFDENLRALEDWEYWLRCINGGMRFRYSENGEALTLIRYHPKSVSKNKSLMLKANIEIRTRIQPSLQDSSLEALNQNGMANAKIALAIEMMHHGEKLERFVELLKYCLQHSKFIPLLNGLRVLLFGR